MHSRMTATIVVLITTTLSFTSLAWAGDANGKPSYDRTRDPHGLQIFMQEGGWCWFQDPRVIIHDGRLIIGGVRGNGSDDAVVGVYDLKEKTLLRRIVLHAGFKHDDHNAPAFYVRPDGRVLAVYALHGNNKIHYYRISKSRDCLEWGAEMQFVHAYPNAGNVTYMNLYGLQSEGKLYNFFRGIAWNPCFITSKDHGNTWGEPTHFIQSELAGRQRPYARYTSNGQDTVAVSFTDGHPHVFGNSIYYAAFRNGKFFRADGTLLKDLSDGPLKPSEAEMVFRGSGVPVRAGNARAPRSAWTSSIVLDKSGYPHIGYTLYLSNDDHRYRIASWNGTEWLDREVARGGKCLYDRESSYTGLISLDPSNPTDVVISTDVNPATGKDMGGKHEIYRAHIGPSDNITTIQWNAMTHDSPVRNLRPIVVTGDGYRVFLWQRGDFISYTSFQLDTVGVIEPLK